VPTKSTATSGVPLDLLDERRFWTWAADAEISTKDAGLLKMNHPWRTSRIMVRRVFEGMRRGTHQFLVTKAGQVAGTTTATLLMGYFATHLDGVQGVVVANEDDVREKVRQDLLAIAATVKNQRPTLISNAKVVQWDNHARFMMMTAGPQTGGRVGVGRGYALCLGTEVPLWKNPKAMTILRTRWSSEHPYRLALFEGTARGKNWWWDVWQEAEGAPGIERIELCWWMHDGYALDEASPEFRHYWDGRPTRRERRWAREIAKRYDVEIQPGQWAWRRKYVVEQAGGDDKTANQEMPSLIEEAFEATGISFLGDDPIRRVRRAVNVAKAPERYRYEWGPRIEDTKLQRTIPDHATLEVWEQPEATSGYVVAAVPAHSATQACPDWIASAWKATRDTLEQVAEFGDDECGMQAFAWVCKHLHASYHSPRRAFILETVGLGMGVLDEIKLLESYAWGTNLSRGKLLEFNGASHHFHWRRSDRDRGGRNPLEILACGTGARASRWRRISVGRTGAGRPSGVGRGSGRVVVE
jgi:hypothetical protein